MWLKKGLNIIQSFVKFRTISYDFSCLQLGLKIVEIRSASNQKL